MSLNNKKGVEMSLQTVVIALLVLIVLAILIFLLFGGTKAFTSGTTCENKGGSCVASQTQCTNGYIGPWDCKGINEGQKCCVPVGT
ncbi:MAG: hypothetical protein ACP5NV_02605 [Candidatus Woesearchaeota archaeon]